MVGMGGSLVVCVSGKCTRGFGVFFPSLLHVVSQSLVERLRAVAAAAVAVAAEAFVRTRAAYVSFILFGMRSQAPRLLFPGSIFSASARPQNQQSYYARARRTANIYARKRVCVYIFLSFFFCRAGGLVFFPSPL